MKQQQPKWTEQEIKEFIRGIDEWIKRRTQWEERQAERRKQETERKEREAEQVKKWMKRQRSEWRKEHLRGLIAEIFLFLIIIIPALFVMGISGGVVLFLYDCLTNYFMFFINFFSARFGSDIGSAIGYGVGFLLLFLLAFVIEGIKDLIVSKNQNTQMKR